MGFRGVLLAAREGDTAHANASGSTNAFRVVCPDASLQLPTAGMPRNAPHLHEQKVIVTDYVTTELQQVTRLAGVVLQRETHSVLWVTVAPVKVHDGDMALGSTFAFDPQSLVHYVCYSFYFRTPGEFDIFERAHAASRRLQQFSLVEKSVHLEMAIQKEVAQRPHKTVPVPAGHEELKRRREQLRKELQRHAVKEQEQKQVKEICEKAAQIEAERVRAAAAEAKRAKEIMAEALATKGTEAGSASADDATTSPIEECILCGTDSTCRRFAGKFVNHPYLLKDGRGKPVTVCKVCLQHVLKRRVEAERARGGAFPTTDDLCGLCTEPVAQIKGESKACTHPQCPRVYCAPCLKKLFGKAQASKVFRIKKWHCPNCETPEDSADKPAEVDVGATGTDGGTKKRKRDHDKIKKEEALIMVDAEEVMKPAVDIDLVVARDPKTGATMTPLDYASTYYEFLTSREEQPTLSKDSEDVCFCCKDGGDVLECDWKKCPKVYHADCLGYPVQEDVEWFCPRHRCFKCGFSAQYSCRTCVTSFCKNHLPEGIKELGPATAEIPDVTYVLCGACDFMSSKALEQKKISKGLYDRLLRPPSPRKQQQRGSENSKQKKRSR